MRFSRQDEPGSIADSFRRLADCLDSAGETAPATEPAG
jgi:hypothetical protein